VLDIDGPAGRDALAALERAHGPLLATLLAYTARGEHRYFSVGAQSIACSSGRLGSGLDVRGRGGYLAALAVLAVADLVMAADDLDVGLGHRSFGLRSRTAKVRAPRGGPRSLRW